MTTINHPIFKSNNDGDLKLESGEIDASQQFTAQIWKMWEAGKPVSTWMKKKPYHVPGNIPLLIFNLNKPGLENPKVRLAIAYSIDYPNIATTAMSDYSEPANASLIIPTGYESKFYDAAAVEAEGWKFDPAKAVEILEGELKAKKGSDGIYELPDGTKLGGWKLITPTGWTDWNTACEIVAKSVKEVGIGISTEFPQAPTMRLPGCRTATSTCCMYSYTGVNPASPWIRFRDALDDRGVPAPGKSAFWNYNRFKNSEVAGPFGRRCRCEVRCRGQDGLRRPRQDLSRERAGSAADVPPAGVLRVQREQLGELPDRGEPIRSPHVAGRGHPVAVQDQEGWNLKLNLI